MGVFKWLLLIMKYVQGLFAGIAKMGAPAFPIPSSVLVNQDSMGKTAPKGGGTIQQISERLSSNAESELQISDHLDIFCKYLNI